MRVSSLRARHGRTSQLGPATALVATVAFAATANAGPEGTWTWTWAHVEPGTHVEITPSVVGAVSPGEAVEIRGTFSFTGLGSTQTGAGGHAGEIAGLAMSRFTLVASPNHGGQFDSEIVRDPAYPGWPTLLPDLVRKVAIGQLAQNGLPLGTTQSVFTNAVRIRWEPMSYDERIVTFDAQAAFESYVPTGTNLFIAHGGLPTYDVYHLAMSSVGSSWGTVEVPIIPAPAGLLLLGLSGIIATRRCRALL